MAVSWIFQNNAKKVNKENSTVTFKDVAGVDEALEELQEIREFLIKPDKFRNVGAKIPKGVLLYILRVPVRPAGKGFGG